VIHPTITMNMLLNIRELSAYLAIKPSTLYAWAAQGKIPCVKIHGLLRFRRDEIEPWLEHFRQNPVGPHIRTSTTQTSRDLNALIASVKRQVYTSAHGETRPRSSLIGKGERDGALEA